ncbi:hypothetical protein PYCCODRAFT_1427910 [Trametes coccinea BRFM310]|uniref:Uncharacterized protein n=1 Tax=Trametes coccinea (strain BRFM310) TaxID=1353009 RepID=A0A1Y2ICV1_TRAC3|nr:hypothetical protein PYCCODRAFT_1427910 [Trametes coccinea BRFM310]
MHDPASNPSPEGLRMGSKTLHDIAEPPIITTATHHDTQPAELMRNSPSTPTAGLKCLAEAAFYHALANPTEPPPISGLLPLSTTGEGFCIPSFHPIADGTCSEAGNGQLAVPLKWPSGTFSSSPDLVLQLSSAELYEPHVSLTASPRLPSLHISRLSPIPEETLGVGLSNWIPRTHQNLNFWNVYTAYMKEYPEREIPRVRPDYDADTVIDWKTLLDLRKPCYHAFQKHYPDTWEDILRTFATLKSLGQDVSANVRIKEFERYVTAIQNMVSRHASLHGFEAVVLITGNLGDADNDLAELVTTQYAEEFLPVQLAKSTDVIKQAFNNHVRDTPQSTNQQEARFQQEELGSDGAASLQPKVLGSNVPKVGRIGLVKPEDSSPAPDACGVQCPSPSLASIVTKDSRLTQPLPPPSPALQGPSIVTDDACDIQYPSPSLAFIVAKDPRAAHTSAYQPSDLPPIKCEPEAERVPHVQLTDGVIHTIPPTLKHEMEPEPTAFRSKRQRVDGGSDLVEATAPDYLALSDGALPRGQTQNHQRVPAQQRQAVFGHEPVRYLSRDFPPQENRFVPQQGFLSQWNPPRPTYQGDYHMHGGMEPRMSAPQWYNNAPPEHGRPWVDALSQTVQPIHEPDDVLQRSMHDPRDLGFYPQRPPQAEMVRLPPVQTMYPSFQTRQYAYNHPPIAYDNRRRYQDQEYYGWRPPMNDHPAYPARPW